MEKQIIHNFIELNDFTGGLNDNIDPQLIENNELQAASNFHLDKTGTLISRDGQEQITATAQSGTVTSIFGCVMSTGSSPTLATIYDNTSSEGLFFQITAANIWAALGKGAGVTGPGTSLFKWVMFNDLMIGVGDRTAASGGWPVISWNGVDTSASILAGVVSASITAPSDVAIWNRRVCLSQGIELYISDAGVATTWTGGDSQVFRFRSSSFDEEAIVALYPFQGKLIVFKKSSIWEVDPGNGLAESFTIRQIGFNIGCDARHCVIDIGRDLLFANQAGINSLQDIRDKGGLAVSGRISQKIYRTIWSTISINYLRKAVSFYNPELEEVMFSIPTQGNNTNDTVIVLNIQYTAQNGNPSWWPYIYNKEISCFARRPGVKREQVECGSYDGHIYRVNSTTLDAGALYVPSMQTKEFNFESVLENKLFHDITVNFLQDDDFDVNVVAYFNNEDRNNSYTVQIFSAAAKWDVAVWDTAIWTVATAGMKRKYFGYVARNVSLKITSSATIANAANLNIVKIVFNTVKLSEDFAVT